MENIQDGLEPALKVSTFTSLPLSGWLRNAVGGCQF